jgi:hypothetical protein
VLSTAISILAAIALLLPGFIMAELSAARGARSSRSDLELALRALSYALIVHLLFLYWTAHLVQRIEAGDQWRDHVLELAAYAAVVLLLVPVVLGTVANVVIARQERKEGPPSLWAAALGAGEARDGYDYAFQRLHEVGGYVIVELVGHSPDEPRLIGGKYGRGSAVGQTPAEHDLYLEQLYTVREDADGVRVLHQTTEPPRGVWIAASQIVRFEIVQQAE